MSAHTPGPWAQGSNNGPTIYSAGKEQIANVRIVDTFPGRAEGLANAHLIAAAPDLLAVCEAFATRLDEAKRLGIKKLYLVDDVDLRAAIAKARGK